MKYFLLAAGLLSAAAVAAAPALPGPAFPVFGDAAALTAACDASLKRSRAELRAFEAVRPDARWLRRYDDFAARVDDQANPQTFLAHVHPDKAMRDAAEACELRWQDFYSSLGQNEKVFKALKALSVRDPIDRLLRQTLMEGLEDAGVGLPGPERARAKALSDQLAALAQTFQRNIRDAAVKVPFTEAELVGVPEGVWKSAPRDSEGRVLLGLDMPVYMPLMQGAVDAAARERMWRAKQRQGGEANLKLLGEIAALRREYAALFGQRSFAQFNLRRNMAGTPERANTFLDEVKAAVREGETRDLEELRRAKASHLKQPLEAVKIDRWDVVFYEERVRRERYSVDQEAFRPYFPPQQSLAFVMRVIEKMMGVRFTRVEGVPLWHPDAQAWRVSDAASGRALASLYVDLYPRDGKYNHAAVWPLRGGSVAAGRTPVAALVVNFDRQGLALDELETLLHEFGHAVHTSLSATRYSAQAGTSVKRDFVEAPSQMLEDWVYDRRVLDVFKEVCPECKPVPDALLAQAVAARDFGKGVLYARQHLYASYDLALYDSSVREPLALWQQMEGATPLGYVPDSLFPANFEHIATHYGAGYYGYLWSLVVAMDLRTAFAGDKLDPKVGRRYRDIVLANGSQRLPDDLLRQFLGRENSARAFYDYLRK